MFDKRSDLGRFLAVVDAGKIQVAAERLGMTQPALSRLIGRLERGFGGALFERLSTGVRTTALGAAVERQARHLLGEFELADAEVLAVAAGRKGRLSVSAGPAFMAAILPGAVARLQAALPDIEVHLLTASYAQGLALLHAGEVDLHCGGFDSEHTLPRSLIRHALLDMDLGVVASESHPIHALDPIPLEALTGYPWLGFDLRTHPAVDHDWPPLGSVLDELFERTGTRVRTLVQCDMAALSLMNEGPYLTYLGLPLARRFARPRLREVPSSLSPRRFRAGIVARRSSGAAVVARFGEIVRASLEGLS